MRYSIPAMLASLCVLAACTTTPMPSAGPAPAAKPALATPPASVMTPQGY
ncbi:hypothetical protein [Lichenicoccus sp.]